MKDMCLIPGLTTTAQLAARIFNDLPTTHEVEDDGMVTVTGLTPPPVSRETSERLITARDWLDPRPCCGVCGCTAPGVQYACPVCMGAIEWS